MKDFTPNDFTAIAILATQLNERPTLNSSDDIIPQNIRLSNLAFFKRSEKACDKIELKFSQITARDLVKALSIPTVHYKELYELSMELTTRIVDEMKLRMFFSIEPNKQHFLEKNLFTIDVEIAFPSIIIDIEEAGKCLAFELWTASIFHSMRVLEIGLKVLAKELSVPHDYTNWENIINGIEAKIKTVKPTTYGVNWKVKQKFYSEAALQFRYFKDAWRNHVMHVHGPYGEQSAENIFGHTKEFMIHLATQLKE